MQPNLVLKILLCEVLEQMLYSALLYYSQIFSISILNLFDNKVDFLKSILAINIVVIRNWFVIFFLFSLYESYFSNKTKILIMRFNGSHQFHSLPPTKIVTVDPKDKSILCYLDFDQCFPINISLFFYIHRVFCVYLLIIFGSCISLLAPL